MSNQSYTTDTYALLLQLNDQKAEALIPAVVFLTLLMAIGVAGNCMVCYFYGYKTKTTPATCFILALAIFDLFSCLISIPVEITDMRLFYTFDNVPACKILVFVNHFATVSSAFTLCAIAVDRYRRICKPFERQLSIKQARIISAVCAFGGVFFGWPSFALYSVELVSVNNTYNIDLTGYDCTSVKADSFIPYIWAFNVVQFIGFIVVTIALIVSYLFVGRQLYKRKKFRFYVAQKSLRRTASGTTVYSQTESSENPPSHSFTLPTSIPEEKENEEEDGTDNISIIDESGYQEEPPEMSDSVPDLRELVISGLPMVDTDRPSSGRLVMMEIDDERPVRRSLSVLTSRTDTSGKSKRSIRSVKSVTICEASENQIFSIEPRDRSQSFTWRPGSARSNSTWSNSITRPNSQSSFGTVVSRPSSVLTVRSNSAMSDAPTESDRPSSAGSRKLRTNAVHPESKPTSDIITKPPPPQNVVPRTNSLRRTASSESTSSKMNTDTDNVKDLRMKMLNINTVKYTTIMIVSAVVFVLSCVPYLCLAVWRSTAPDDLVYMFDDTQLVWFQIGIRSYFLNCAINPLIYGFFNSQFREFFSSLFCGCCRKTKTKPVLNKKESFRTSRTIHSNSNTS